MKFKPLQTVVLDRDLPEHGLRKGDLERGILDMKDHPWRGVFAPLQQAIAPGAALKSLSPAARRVALMSRRRQLRAPRYKSEVSRFFTLSIEQVFEEDAPPSFRVRHELGSTQVAIATGEASSGSLPPWVRPVVRKWLASTAMNWPRTGVVCRSGCR